MVQMNVAVLACVALTAATIVVDALNLPGVTAMSYVAGDEVVLRVNALSSSAGVIPYPFYSFKTCKPADERMQAEKKRENLGELLWGDQIEPSEYKIRMLQNETCVRLCDPIAYTPEDMKKLEKLIEQQYRGNLILDNLPVAQRTFAGPKFPKVLLGYPLGLSAKHNPKKTTIINNHLQFTIGYHEPNLHDLEQNTDVFRVVQFFATAHSVKYSDKEECAKDKPFNPSAFGELDTSATSVTYTYSVEWVEEPDVAWATRWDIYMRGAEHDDKIHWMSIVNSLFIVFFLSTMVAMIMLRVLHKDFNRYNDPENAEEAIEEAGWKNVHGDVFRGPVRPVLFAALVGSGTQVVGMVVVTLGVACLGFLSPSNRGGLLSAIILLFVLMGSFGGFVGAKLMKYFKVQSWRNAFVVACLLPVFLISVYVLINFVQWYKHASSAIRVTTLLVVIALWLGVSLPLALVGAAVGYRRPAFQAPCTINAVPRIIPTPRWWLNPTFSIPAAGVLPFGAAFIELVFILSSFWQGRMYYAFAFLALVVVILCVTCAEVVIVMLYLQLCRDDYCWWWRSFLMGASCGLHTFLYSVYYLAAVLNIRQASSVMIYLGYMFLGSSLFAVFMGTVAFWSASFFVWKIYSSIKID